MEIKNKVFIVTGGASGLGAGTARMLVAEGAQVILADVQDEAGKNSLTNWVKPMFIATLPKKLMGRQSSLPH